MASNTLSSDVNESTWFHSKNRQTGRIIAEIATPVTDLAYRIDDSEFAIVPEKLADQMTLNISNLVATTINVVLDDISVTDARIVPVYVLTSDLRLVIRFMTGGDENDWSDEVQQQLEIVFEHIAQSLIEEPSEAIEIDGKNITDLIVSGTSPFLKKNQNRKIKQPLRIRINHSQTGQGEGINISSNLRVIDYEPSEFEFSGVAMVDGVIWSESRAKFVLQEGNGKGKPMYVLFDPGEGELYRFLVDQLYSPGSRINFKAIETTQRDGNKSTRLLSAEVIQYSLFE